MKRYFGLHTLDGEWHALMPRYLLVADCLKGKRVLEIGCGRGVGTAMLAEAGVEDLIAIDHRPDLVQDAQSRFDEIGSVFQLMFYEEMDFKDDSFDVVVCLDDSFPIADGGLLQEVRRVLTPDGIFIGAFEEPGAYGLDKVLPRDPMQKRNKSPQGSFRRAYASLLQHFSNIKCFGQRPELSYSFAPLEEPDVNAASIDSQSLDGTATQEFKFPDLMRSSPDDEIFEPLRKLGEVLKLGGQGKIQNTSEVVVCTNGEASIESLLSSTRISMPYDAIAARLGRILNDLYRHIDELGQRTLLFEEQVDDRSKLIDDLEEEVRGKRELARDQAGKVDDLMAQINQMAQVPDLSVQYARAQGELAAKQKEILELTADFNRRVQDLMWSVEERDKAVAHLTVSVRDWEVFADELQDQLAGRDLALENQGRILARLSEELRALKEETEDTDAPEAEEVEEASEAEPETVDRAVVDALEKTVASLRETLSELRARWQKARVDIERAEESVLRAEAEVKDRARYGGLLETRLDKQEADARAFAQEVSDTFEEINTLKKTLEKAHAEIENLKSKTTKQSDASMNLEKELSQRKVRIQKLERELMGKNIEVSSLEKENVNLLRLKSDRDKVVQTRDDTIQTLQAQIEDLKAQLAAVPEPAPEPEPEPEPETEPEPAPAVIEPKKPEPKPKVAESPAPQATDDVTQESLREQGYVGAGRNLWKKEGHLAILTARYWVVAATKGGGKIQLRGSEARTRTIKADKLMGYLTDKFGVSASLAKRAMGQIEAL